MKKVTLLLAVVLGLSFASFAQKNATPLTASASIGKTMGPSTEASTKDVTVDTIWSATSYMPCGDSLTYYSIGANGYLTGNNTYGDLEKGMLIKHTGAGSVTGVIVMVVKKGTVGTGTCAVNIYSKDAVTNLPGTLLGTSVAKTLSSITTNTNTFTFTTPVAVTGDFFANVVLPQVAGDTIIVISTKSTCQGPDSVAVDQASDNSFMYMKTGWGWNGDLAIWPIVESGSATTTYPVNFSVIGANGTLTATVDGTPITTGTSVESGKDVVFTATPASTYIVKEWINNSTVVSGNTTNNYTLTNLTAAATVSVEFRLPSAIANFVTENMRVYTSNNKIVIDNNSGKKINQVIVYNMFGQEVEKMNVQKSGSLELTTNIATGNYIVRLVAENGVGIYKISVR